MDSCWLTAKCLAGLSPTEQVQLDGQLMQVLFTCATWLSVNMAISHGFLSRNDDLFVNLVASEVPMGFLVWRKPTSRGTNMTASLTGCPLCITPSMPSSPAQRVQTMLELNGNKNKQQGYLKFTMTSIDSLAADLHAHDEVAVHILWRCCQAVNTASNPKYSLNWSLWAYGRGKLFV